MSRWLWLLFLLLLLGLAGFYLLRGNRTTAALTVTAPAEGASLSGPVTVSGTGQAGQTVTVSENGASVTTVQVGQDGTFSASLPAPSAGSHTYSVSESGSQAALSRTVTVEASAPSATETPAPGTDTGSAAQPAPGTAPAASGAAPAGAAPSTSVDGTAPSSDAQTPDTSDQTPAAVDPAAPAPADQATPADGNLSIATPSGGVSVPAGGLTLRGNGPANTSLTVTEDGTDLGQAQTDASGAWTFQVPSPAPGPHTYRVAAGGVTSDLQLTVAEGSAAAATNCSEAFSLSLKDEQQVSSPFRFGGTGSGQAYLVTVFRGDRQIGQKLLPLDSSCNWSYTSRPGPGRVTYSLRGQGQTEVAGEVTLDVLR